MRSPPLTEPGRSQPEVSAMRHGTARRRTTMPHTTWTPERVQVAHWRRKVRPIVLRAIADQTTGSRFSRRLVTALLEELHISDDFDALIGPPLVDQPPTIRNSWPSRSCCGTAGALTTSHEPSSDWDSPCPRSHRRQTSTSARTPIPRPRLPRSRPRTLVPKGRERTPVERNAHVGRIAVNANPPSLADIASANSSAPIARSAIPRADS